MIRHGYFVIYLALLVISHPGYSENTIGVNYTRAVNDQNLGVIGNYTYPMEDVDMTIAGQLQAGDGYRGNSELRFTFKLPLPIDIALHSTNTIKGYTLDTLGRTNDLGADIVIPVRKDTVDVTVGIFGRNGNPFAPRTALGILTDAGFAEDSLDASLGNLTLAEGISLKDGSSLNAAIATKFKHGRLAIDIKALLELMGEGETVHQGIVSLSTTGRITNTLHWTLKSDITLQAYQGKIEYETTWYIGSNFTF